MKSPATLFGHPVHQILVMFPIGMFGFAAGCDAVGLASGRRSWLDGAQRAIGAGVIGAGLAAPFGLLDYVAVPEGTRAKAIGRMHGIGNVGVLGLFAASWLVRRMAPRRTKLAASLSFAGLTLAGVTAWLGTELVNRLGVGVYTPTSFDAPSSLAEAPFAGRLWRTVETTARGASTINP